MSKVLGKNIICGKLTGTTFAPFAYSKNATISIDRDMIEVSSPSTGTSQEFIPGRKGWSISCSCLLSDNESAVWALFNNGTKFTVSWRETGGREWTGDVYIKSLKATGSIHEMAKFDIEMQGTGDLTYKSV